MTLCDVLIVTGEFPPLAGGAGLYAAEFAKSLEAFGAKVAVLAPDYCQRASGQSLQLRAEILARFPTTGPKPVRLLRAARAIADTRRQLRPKVTVLANWNAHRAGVFLKGSGLVLLVYGSELLSLLHRPWLLPLFAGVYRRAALTFACSEYARSVLLSLGVAKANTRVLYPGVSQVFLDPPPDDACVLELRVKWQIPSSAPVVVSVGRLVRRKGFDVAIRAIAEVSNVLGNVRYIIAGDGPERENLEKLSSALSCADQVKCCGQVAEQEKLELYDLCDCHVMLSRQVGFDVEGYGISFAEAALRCRPSVGTNHGGIPEAVQDGATGFLVRCDDVAQTASRLTALLSDRDLAARLGRAARDRALIQLETRDTSSLERLLAAL